MHLKCPTHSAPEQTLKQFLENLFSSLFSINTVKVYDVNTTSEAIDLMLQVLSCPVCSRNMSLTQYADSVVRYKKLEEGAKMPFKAHATDAGWDLYSISTVDLLPHRTTEVCTGIALEMPENLYATFEGRSSFHSRGIQTNRSIIDSGFRGELTVFMRNDTDTAVIIRKWERFAQLVFHYNIPVKLVVTKELTPSDRGENKFGSTGQF